MNSLLKKLLSSFAVALTITLGAAYYIYSNTARIIVFHTNDIHGWIMPQEVKSDPKNPKSETNLTGGFAVLSNYLKKFPKGYLLLDSGDFFQGTPEGDLTKGDAVIECMNRLGYHASALGNHEYDLGEENVNRLSKMAKFPFLSANILDEKTRQRVSYAQPYLIKEIEGVKVGVIGLITSRMKTLVLSKNIQGLAFEREVEALKKTVEELKGQGVQVIILAAHVGLETKDSPPDFEGEKYLAAQVPGIHLILGGHTHFKLEEAYQDERNKTLIAHNQSGLKTVTKTMMRVWKKSGKLFCYSYKSVPLLIKKHGEDPEVKALVETVQKKVGEKLDAVIGNSSMLLDRKGAETLLGNWQTDLMRRFTKSDFAFQNIGGIRADLPQGPLTMRHIYLTSPFDNTIVTLELTGSQVKEVMEHSVSGAQGILQISGLKMVYDKTREQGDRVTEITVNGNPIELKKNYRVATNNFVAAGGDGFSTFKEGRNIRDTMKLLRDLQTDFVKDGPPISAKIEGRVRSAQ